MISDLQMDSLGGGAWRITWTSDLVDPTFYVYRDGQLLGTTRAAEWVVRLAAGDRPVFEILDSDDDTAPTATRGFPGFVTLGWYASTGSDRYLIQELVGVDWTTRRTIHDRGQGYFRWKSRFLEDVTTHQFRVVPIGTNENTGTAAAFSVLMVRHPDAPEVEITYSSGTGKLTIS